MLGMLEGERCSVKKFFASTFLLIIFSTLIAFAGPDIALRRADNVIDLKTLPDGRYQLTYPNGVKEWPVIQRRLLEGGKKTYTALFVLWDLNFETGQEKSILGEVEAHELEWRDSNRNPDIKTAYIEIKNGKVIYWHPDAKKQQKFYCLYKEIAGKTC